MSLVGGGPFTVPPMDPDFKYQQVIILMTDGLNTQNRWYNNATDIDTRQQIACDNVSAVCLRWEDAITEYRGRKRAGELLRNPENRRPRFRGKRLGNLIGPERQRNRLSRIGGLDDGVEVEPGAGQLGPPPGLPFTSIGLQPIHA
jgi:hypothetical protein